MQQRQRRILVIRYGGFGDIVLSSFAFAAIRAHHPDDHIAALTSRPFCRLLEASRYFDEVLVDDRLKPWRLAAWLRLVRLLRGRRFDRVYDLQRNDRTAIFYRMLGAGRQLEWSGVIAGCSHFVRDDPHDRRHIVERLAEQLAVAGIPDAAAAAAVPPPPDFSWLCGDIGRFGLPRPYALIVPGGAPHRPQKRAPAESFAGLARHLAAGGVAPVLIGTAAAERAPIDLIRGRCPTAVDLSDRTSFGDIAELARHAVGAVGNDTGAMHLAAAVGCPSLVLFAAASDPDRIAPRGRQVEILRMDSLAALDTGTLIAAWQRLLLPRCGT
jgi:ADP-heptose:LPS heptosyltransferase